VPTRRRSLSIRQDQSFPAFLFLSARGTSDARLLSICIS